jgi:hypothetical protein
MPSCRGEEAWAGTAWRSAQARRHLDEEVLEDVPHAEALGQLQPLRMFVGFGGEGEAWARKGRHVHAPA